MAAKTTIIAASLHFGACEECGIKSCHRIKLFYTGQVGLNWNFLWLAMLTAVALCAAGCGGINAGGSVSPAMFLMKTDSAGDDRRSNACA